MTSSLRATSRLTLLLVLGLVLSACGWQLRGTTSTPSMETLTVSGASTELRYTLEDELEDKKNQMNFLLEERVHMENQV